MVLDWFWIGFGLVLVSIHHSFVSKINAIHLKRYMAIVWRMNELNLPKPIQNQLKTNQRIIANRNVSYTLANKSPKIVEVRILNNKF